MIVLPLVTVTAVGQTIMLPIHDPTQCAALVLNNESAYDLTVQCGGQQKTVAAWTADVVFTPSGASSFSIVPTLNLPAATQPNNVLTVNMYGPSEPKPSAATYPMPLQRATQTNAGEQVIDTYVIPINAGPNNVSRTMPLPEGTLALLITGIDNNHVTCTNADVYDEADHDILWGNAVMSSGYPLYVALSSRLSGSVLITYFNLYNTDTVPHTITVVALSDVRVVSIPASDILNVQFPSTPMVNVQIQGAGADTIGGLGQALMAGSLPVVLASNQSAVLVTDRPGTASVVNGYKGGFSSQAQIDIPNATVPANTVFKGNVAVAGATTNPAAAIAEAVEVQLFWVLTAGGVGGTPTQQVASVLFRLPITAAGVTAQLCDTMSRDVVIYGGTNGGKFQVAVIAAVGGTEVISYDSYVSGVVTAA